MRLRDLIPHGERADFAALVNCSPTRLSSIASGKRIPSIALARRICIATEGKVTVKELLLGDETPHPLERWSDSDAYATSEAVAEYELASLTSPAKDAAAPGRIHGGAQR